MKVWPIVVFLFIFSSVSTVFEEFGGLGGVHVNEVGINTTGLQDDAATIYEIDDSGDAVASLEDDISIIAGAEMLLKSMTVFVKIILNAFYVRGILLSYSVPEAIADMIQGIVTIIYVAGVIQFASNRRVESR